MSWRYASLTLTVLLAICASAQSVSAQDATAGTTQVYAGQWTAEGDVPADPAGSGVPPASAPHGGGRNGGARGGAAGMGSGAGGMSGGHHHGRDHAPAGGSPADTASERESSDRALERLFARQVTITTLEHPHRVRFDTGMHAVDLSIDGGNVSGPGVGGTVALTIDKNALVVDSLSDSGYVVKERYVVTDDGRRLELHATLRKGDGPEREIVRVFAHPAAKASAAAQ